MLNAQPSPKVPVQVAGATTVHTYSLWLKPGEDLRNVLEAVTQQQRIGAGLVFTCVGNLTDVALRLDNRDEVIGKGILK